MKKAILLYILIFISTIAAQWKEDGIPICDTSANSGYYMLPQIASDGNGGAFICWKDSRNGNFDIYAQHVDKDGKILWQRNGIPIVNDTNTQQFPRIISDGKRGAFIAWENSNGIYAQRIDNNGNSLWEKNGIKIAETPGLFINLSEDNKGGVLVGWANFPAISEGVPYIQRLDSLGNRVWADSGIQISYRLGDVSSNDVSVTHDDFGGAFIAWAEGDYPNYRIYIQHVDKDGDIKFQKNGIQLSADSLQNIDVVVSSDSKGGAIISWASLVNPTSLDTSFKYVQRTSPTGEKLWGVSGINLGRIESGGARRQILDGSGGVYIGHSKWIQHIDSSGNKLWKGEGASFTIAPSLFINSSQVKNGQNGIWNFFAQEPPDSQYLKIYAQYIDNDGNPKWGNYGIPLTIINSHQDWPRAASDDNGNAIVAWDDFRNGHSNIYSMKVNTSGLITSINENIGKLVFPNKILLQQNYPNPFNPETIITYSIHKKSRVKLTIVDILGNEIFVLVNKEEDAGNHSIKFSAKNLSSGIYFYQLQVSGYSITKKMVVLH